MPICCPACGVQMPDESSYCPGCGAQIAAPAAAVPCGITAGIGDNIAGALAYFFLPAVLFVLVDPFKKSRFIRFHSFQALFLAIAAIAAGLVLRLVVAVLGLIPALGQFIVLLIMMVVGIGCLVFWAVLLVKALQGELFRLPFIGQMAAKQAGISVAHEPVT